MPVLQPSQIANLPPGRVLLIRRGIAPVIGRVQMAWRRRDVRAYEFALDHPQWAARLTRWSAELRRSWERLARPERAAATATRSGRVRAHRVPAQDDLPSVVELDPPTVPLPVITTGSSTPDERPALTSTGGVTP